MYRLARILGGVAVALVVIGIFAATQIGDAEGRTLADRIPVVGPLVRAVGLGSPGNGQPMFRSFDEPAEIVASATCGNFKEADSDARRRIAKAFVEVGGRSDERFHDLDPQLVVQAFAEACSPDAERDTLITDLIARSQPPAP